MSDSIREKILKHLKASLEEIRISNGYQTDIDNVQRPEQDGNDFRNTPNIIIVPAEEDKSDENTFPEMDCRLPILLILRLRHDKDIYGCSTDELLNRFLADVEKAVFADNGHLRGGNAVTTRNLGNVPFETSEGQPYWGTIVRIEVQYRHLYDDPYS